VVMEASGEERHKKQMCGGHTQSRQDRKDNGLKSTIDKGGMFIYRNRKHLGVSLVAIAKTKEGFNFKRALGESDVGFSTQESYMSCQASMTTPSNANKDRVCAPTSS